MMTALRKSKEGIFTKYDPTFKEQNEKNRALAMSTKYFILNFSLNIELRYNYLKLIIVPFFNNSSTKSKKFYEVFRYKLQINYLKSEMAMVT